MGPESASVSGPRPVSCPPWRAAISLALRAVRAGLRDEDGLAVVAQLLDALLDVGERAVVATLGRGGEVGAGVPPARELLDGGDVDDPVVQERLERLHVAGQEGAVGGHGVAGERGPAAVGAVLLDVGQHLLLGVRERRTAVELVEQAGLLVHRPDELHHLVEGLLRRLDDHVDALAEHVELEVGDECRHLDERVGAQVESGHLAVDPHQSVAHDGPPYLARARTLSGSTQPRLLWSGA